MEREKLNNEKEVGAMTGDETSKAPTYSPEDLKAAIEKVTGEKYSSIIFLGSIVEEDEEGEVKDLKVRQVVNGNSLVNSHAVNSAFNYYLKNFPSSMHAVLMNEAAEQVLGGLKDLFKD